MRILKIWDGEYPWDVRTEKVCQALSDLGHTVHMVARNRDGRAILERLPECTVHRMTPWPLLGKTLDATSQFPAFFNPRWIRHVAQTARQEKAELIIVRDIPLAPVAYRVGRQLGLPVILDMAENYPAMIDDYWTTGTTRFGDFVIRNPRIVRIVERWVLARMDHILVVVEESRDRLVSLGVPPDRVSIVSNTPRRRRIVESASTENPASRRRDPQDVFRMVYLGLMEEPRGVRLVLDAVAAARRRGIRVELDLLGDGRSLDAFRARAKELDLYECKAVRFHGYVPYQDALSIVSQADAGLIPHFANESWETTIPNKLFDYMSLSLPVIASDVTPVVRILKETGAGRTFRDRDARDLERVIVELAADDQLSRIGEAGIEAIRRTHNWENEVRRLEAAIDLVSGATGISRGV